MHHPSYIEMVPNFYISYYLSFSLSYYFAGLFVLLFHSKVNELILKLYIRTWMSCMKSEINMVLTFIITWRRDWFIQILSCVVLIRVRLDPSSCSSNVWRAVVCRCIGAGVSTVLYLKKIKFCNINIYNWLCNIQ